MRMQTEFFEQYFLASVIDSRQVLAERPPFFKLTEAAAVYLTLRADQIATKSRMQHVPSHASC
jgi:hypothetical protein